MVNILAVKSTRANRRLKEIRGIQLDPTRYMKQLGGRRGLFFYCGEHKDRRVAQECL